MRIKTVFHSPTPEVPPTEQFIEGSYGTYDEALRTALSLARDCSEKLGERCREDVVFGYKATPTGAIVIHKYLGGPVGTTNYTSLVKEYIVVE